MLIDKDDIKNKLVIRKEFKFPGHRVFDAWTKPEHLKKWLFPGEGITLETVELTLQVGASYKFGYRDSEGLFQVVTGTFQHIEVPKKLVFSWMWNPPQPEAGVVSLVTVEFHDKDGGTELILIHEKLKDQESLLKHEWGWCGALANLDTFFEKE